MDRICRRSRDAEQLRWSRILPGLSPGLLFLLTAAGMAWTAGIALPESRMDEMLERTGRLVEIFWKQIPVLDCKESVTREKLEKRGKVEFREKSEFDYVALTKAIDEDLTVEELRIPLHPGAENQDSPPLLESNGFPTLLLIFHPRYQGNYRYQLDADVTDPDGSIRIRFEHLQGAPSTSAVMIQGKAYPLELKGTAWIDGESGAIRKIEAGLVSPIRELNIEDFTAEVIYEPHQFSSESTARWLPAEAKIELRTERQHWLNIHRYSQYKLFTVETKEANAR